MIFQKKKIYRRNIITHIVFWTIMFLYFVSYDWPEEEEKIPLLTKYIVLLVLQMTLAYSTILFFIPYLLNKNRKFIFFLSMIVSVYILHVLYVAIRHYYLELIYPVFFKTGHVGLNFIDRILVFDFYYYNIKLWVFPTIILVAIQYYSHQKEVLELREQKKITEINLLKNQLNPHFLFNTLNNLYALALKKSDRTPEIIAKLSEILDYMLYRCKDNFVSLASEVILIDNYIVLEKIRYGKRLNITFDYQIENEVKIAPLLLLTFVENAFKHGVTQEIKIASIEIKLQSDMNGINFRMQNSKPSVVKNRKTEERDSIGLRNIKKQLKILYQDSYSLYINNTNEYYLVDLKLPFK